MCNPADAEGFVNATRLLCSRDCTPASVPLRRSMPTRVKKEMTSFLPEQRNCRANSNHNRAIRGEIKQEEFILNDRPWWTSGTCPFRRTQTKRDSVWNDHAQCCCYKSLFITSCLSPIYYKKMPQWFSLFVGILADFQLRSGRNYSGRLNYSGLFGFKCLWADLPMSNDRAPFSMPFVYFLIISWPGNLRCPLTPWMEPQFLHDIVICILRFLWCCWSTWRVFSD